jgi:hypothetical protein
MLGHARFSRGAAMVEPIRMKGIAAIAVFMMFEKIEKKVILSELG